MKYLKKTLSLLLVTALLLTLAPVYAAADSAPETILAGMSLEQKVSQLLMPSFRYYPDGKQGVTELPADIAAVIEQYGFAGVVLFAQNTGDTAKAVKLVDDMQRANAKTAGRTQLLIAIDQEGGRVTRLGYGTQMPGNMALGAANDAELTMRAATIIGQEIMSMGINFNFAPVLDVNSNPANPVIGTRSFSDNAYIVAEQGVSYMKALKYTGAISTLKHFPGHGDTATDSHTGLPLVDKTYDELKSRELVPFQAAIDAGADAIMTAHIQYPQIESGEYVSKLTGEKIHLPATLSKTILTDILRGDMGFDGVIITDAMNMDAIAKHFDPYDAARLAIGAGVDILLMPVDCSTPEGLANLGEYIRTLTGMVESGDISLDQVNDAVLRVLKLKAAHGLMVAYEGVDAEESSIVGSSYHHEEEWELTKKTITLVKNDNDTLPLTKENQKIAVLTAYDNEVLSMEHAIGRLRDEGRLAAGTEITVRSIQRMSAAEAVACAAGAEHVVIITEQGSEAALAGETAKTVDALIESAHASGGDAIIMSCSLPYDAARYQAADAIVIAWSARGMSEDPRVADGAVAQYGPSMPAALYLMLSPVETPTATLPVNIPKLTAELTYSDEILYPLGHGLRYSSVPEPAEFSSWTPYAGRLEFCGKEGQEYIIVPSGGALDWSAAIEPDEDGFVSFSGLECATDYEVYTRVKGGSVAAVTEQTTGLLGYEVRTGDAECVYGDAVTVIPDPEGSYRYQWYYDTVNEEGEHSYSAIPYATSASYTPYDGAGQYLAVGITSRSYRPLEWIDGIGPIYERASLVSLDETSVIVRGNEGQEYLIVPKGTEPDDTDWESAKRPAYDSEQDVYYVIFDGLTPATEYTVYTRPLDTYINGAAIDVCTELAGGIELTEPDAYTVGATVSVSTDPETEYQWYYFDVLVDSGEEVLEAIPGATGASYTITAYDVGKKLAVAAYIGDTLVDIRTGLGPVEQTEGAPEITSWTSDALGVSGTAGQEYAIAKKGSQPDWSKALTPNADGWVMFTGLTPATEYEVYARTSGSEDVGAMSAAATTLDSVGLSCDADELTVGAVLTAEPDPARDDLLYQWYRSTPYTSLIEIRGATEQSYTITEEDLGYTLTVKAFAGSVEVGSNETWDTPKTAPEQTPVRPYVIMQFPDSVVVEGTQGQEYLILKKGQELDDADWENADKTWASMGDTVTFSDLESATPYVIYTRLAETAFLTAGEAVSTETVTLSDGVELAADGYLPGCTLTVSLIDEPDSGDLTYRWSYGVVTSVASEDGIWERYDYYPIDGATDSSYTLREDDVGRYLKAELLRDGVVIAEISEIGPAVATATVEFDSDGGSEVESQTGIAYGGKVTKPADPTREGYSFLGWYYDEDAPWNFASDTVTTDYLYLYAKWSRSGGSGGSGSGGSSGGDTVSVSGSGDSVSVGVSVNGTTATVKAPAEAELDKVIGEGVKTGEVVLDLSALNRDIAAVNIPIGTIKAIERAANDPANDAEGMTVKLTDGSVAFDAKALSAVTGEAEGSSVKLVVDEVKKEQLNSAQRKALNNKKTVSLLEVYLESGGKEIHDLKGGKAAVSVPVTLEAGQYAYRLSVCHIAADGVTSAVPSTYRDRYVTFVIGHLSNYAVTYDADAVCPRDGDCPISAFTDANADAWYHDAVHYASEQGVMSGMGNGMFAPDGATTRAMMAQILYNRAGKPTVSSGSSFRDVAADKWYAPAVSWAETNGVMNGMGAGAFAPESAITREQLVTILYRCAQSKGMSVSGGGSLSGYADANSVSSWAASAMEWAVGCGLIRGRTATTLAPNDTATRAEVAQFILNFDKI